MRKVFSIQQLDVSQPLHISVAVTSNRNLYKFWDHDRKVNK